MVPHNPPDPNSGHPTALAIERPVLVIDDDPAVLSSLKFALEIDGFTVRTYPTAKALLDDPARLQRGCLVIDYHLPDGDGLAVLDELRRRGIGMPAILITTDPGPRLRERAGIAGATIVEKPLFGNRLVEAIRAVFPN